MKNNKIVKIAFLVLSLTLVLGAVFAMGAGAAEPETKTPEIISQNIEYGERFRLMFAVDASTVAEGPVTLTIYSEKPGAETANTVETITVENYTAKEELGTLGVDAYVFTATNGIPYTEMTKEYYIQAEDNAGNKSEIMRYSVAEYLYQRLATTGNKAPTPAQKNLYNNAIAFGKNAQIVVNKVAADSDELISNLRYVTIDGGTIDGFTAGVYPIGKVITPKVVNAIAAKWTVTAYDNGIAAAPAGGQTSFTVTDADKIEVSCNPEDLVSYRINAANFNKVDTYGDASYFNSKIYSYGNNCWNLGGVFASDEEHGAFAKFTYASANNEAIFDVSTKEATADTATAVEFSFDIKIDDSNVTGVTRPRIMPSMSVGSQRITQIGLFYGYADEAAQAGWVNATDKLFIADASKTAWSGIYSYTEIDYKDWFHIRIVYYAGDANCYVYLNGSDNPTIVFDETYVLSGSGFTGDISTINRATLRNYGSNGTGSVISLDNVFFGYTKDTKPAN